MKAQSLRFRLISWYALWLAVIFVATGIAIYFGLRSYLERNLATSQEARGQRIARLLLSSATWSEGELAANIRTDFAPEASGRYIRICQAGGEVFYESGPPADQSFVPARIPPPLLQAGSRRETLPDGTEFVLCTVLAGPAAHPQYFIETGASFSPALRELHGLMWLLAGCALLVAAVALGGGLVLVRRALKPVEEITHRAEGITSRNLSDRLPVSPTGDELEHLTQALNRMIIRLDEAFQHNRRFLADASHELRTPLTILRGELEAMVRVEQLDAAARENIGSLLEEVERLTHLVENLFALSRLDAGLAQNKQQAFDLSKLVSATSEQMCLLAEDKKLQITCHAPEPVLVEGDRARVKQVIVNLLDNAIKYTPAKGRVKLFVFAREREAVCVVCDDGMGIPAEAIPRVFDRFFRVDAARSRDSGGAGIGLSIVKAICLAHGGRVEVESTQGQGSTFRVFFPLSPDQPNSVLT